MSITLGVNDLQVPRDSFRAIAAGCRGQCAVRCVSSPMRALNEKCRSPDRATLKNKSGVDEGAYPVPHFRLRALGGGGQTVRMELAPDCGADLCDLLRTGPSRSRRAISEACNVAGTACEAGGTDVYSPNLAISTGDSRFEDSLRQFFGEQRHPIGPINDLFE